MSFCDLRCKAGIVRKLPVFITLTNTGDDVSGEVQVLVDVNPESRSAYAMPVSLAKGYDKEIVMYAPVNTASRKVDVRFVQNGKVIETANYGFKKLIQPNYPVIGVLSDDPNALRELNGMKLPEGLNFGVAGAISVKERVMMAADEKSAVADIPVEIINVGKNSLPDEVKNLEGFDIIAVSNFDTSQLTEKQNEALENWVAEGNMLFIGTGPNARKVYTGLKSSITLFELQGTKKYPCRQQ